MKEVRMYISRKMERRATDPKPLFEPVIGQVGIIMSKERVYLSRIGIPPFKISMMETYFGQSICSLIAFPIYMRNVMLHLIQLAYTFEPAIIQLPRRFEGGVMDAVYHSERVQFKPNTFPVFFPGNFHSSNEGCEFSKECIMNAYKFAKRAFCKASIVSKNTSNRSKTRRTQCHPICIDLYPLKVRRDPVNFNNGRDPQRLYLNAQTYRCMVRRGQTNHSFKFYSYGWPTLVYIIRVK